MKSRCYKFLFILFALLIFGLVACQGSDKTTINNDGNNSSVEPKVSQSTSPSQTRQNEASNINILDELAEPSVPVENINLLASEPGFRNRKLSIFANALKQEKLFFSYHYKNFTTSEEVDFILAFDNEGNEYRQIKKQNSAQDFLNSEDGEQYLIFPREQIIYNLNESNQTEIANTKEEIKAIHHALEDIYFVGQAVTTFANKQVDFEEYTLNKQMFIRYYFEDTQFLGYRSFDSNGALLAEMQVKELTNNLADHPDLFEIPEGYKIQN